LTLKILLIYILSFNLYALDKIYFLPKQSEEVKIDIIYLLNNSKKTIDIAMYNFTYDRFNNALNKAIKNGVHITLINMKLKLKLNKKIKLIKSKRKLHIKLAIIDNKFVIYGSANWKKKSFNENYEIINITDDKLKLKRFIGIFRELKEKED
jgi:phosphatidylserine/phosphatidylglycerophosphate/cardiolipin synthase-like enzyme